MKKIIVFSFLIASPVALAQQSLSGDEIKALVSGKTVEATIHRQGKPDSQSKMYLAADGTAMFLNSDTGKSGAGTWRIDGKGLHCTKWENQEESCASIVKKGDEYQRIMNGFVRATWNRIADGNTVK